MSIAIVFPLYNEEENILPLLNATLPVITKLTKDFEIIFVDDGSKDRSPQILKQLNKEKYIKVYTLKKNMGKATALYVGFQKATKDIIITMDSDLQDDPKEIPLLVQKIQEGYDFVNGWKKNKHLEKGDRIKRLPSLFFNNLTYLMTKVNVHDYNCPFKAYKKEVAKDLFLYGDMHRYIPVQVGNMGYKYTEVVVSNYPRKYGITKYGSSRILRGFLDLITIKYLVGYKNRPLHAFGTIGLITGTFGFLINTYLFFIWLGGAGIGSRPLLMLGILLMFTGLQFISIGLLGELITNNSARDAEHIIK
ncbi:glycosyltransferase family 2 protein [Candidatus Woesearchaeota archaeon]|nr:glycosyltransferase family 2 protein [Candidatus Woesearchaeota archaeon]